jgi:hypothetical protein
VDALNKIAEGGRGMWAKDGALGRAYSAVCGARAPSNTRVGLITIRADGESALCGKGCRDAMLAMTMRVPFNMCSKCEGV